MKIKWARGVWKTVTVAGAVKTHLIVLDNNRVLLQRMLENYWKINKNKQNMERRKDRNKDKEIWWSNNKEISIRNSMIKD